ncbi:MAG: MFS transporter, partial [Firmicutes bacterium]|nr:MFS transporter [Bacillota bacterium]
FASLILIDRSPEDVGLTARRTGAAGTVKKEEFLAKESSILDLAILFFYVLAVALFIGVSQHLSKFALELGKTAEFGGLLVSASMAGNLAAKAVLGPLNDKIGGRKSTILASAFIGLGSFAVLFSQADAVLFVTAFSVGVIMAVTALQTPLLFRSCTTKEQFDRLYPTECSINTMFTSVSQFFLSAIFDLFGNYTYVFAACGGTLLIGAVVLLILDRSVRSKMAA